MREGTDGPIRAEEIAAAFSVRSRFDDTAVTRTRGSAVRPTLVAAIIHDSMTNEPTVEHEHAHSMTGHVLGQIGLHWPEPGDPCGEGLHLHVSPLLLEPDGHFDFGVLGVFLDMAGSQAGPMRPFVHADISIQRIARPRGKKVFIDARTLRAGKRTSIVQVEAFDELGTRVADSTQQVSYRSFPGSDDAGSDERGAEMRRRFRASFDGVCKLEGRLHDIIGLREGTADDGSSFWTMPSGEASQNGFGGLHGGVAFDLVTDAAVGGASQQTGQRARANGALLRYLAPATVGPFRAVPTVMVEDDGAAFVRVQVYDDGQDARLCILGEVHTTLI